MYSKNKHVIVQYDSPFNKGLPVTMTIKENVNGSYHERLVRKTYEDPYTLVRCTWGVEQIVSSANARIQEYKALYALEVEGKPVKTTAIDAMHDLKIFQMIMRAGKSQLETK